MTLDLDKLMEIASSATPGEWKYHETDSVRGFEFVEGGDWKSDFLHISKDHASTTKATTATLKYIATFHPKLVLEILRRLKQIQTAVCIQAKDDALWLLNPTVSEAYLQQALRDLHHVVEQTNPGALEQIKDCQETSSEELKERRGEK